MSIKIEIFGESASEALAELTAFAGGLSSRPVHEITATKGAVQLDRTDTAIAAAVEAYQAAEKPVTAAQTLDLTAETAEAPKRERGKPSPGRARRTKEEIAEDEAAEAAEAGAALTEQPEPPANISTGDERVDPAHVEAQDAEDETAEVESERKEAFTNDDLKAEMTAYVQKFGMPAVQEDGPKIYAAALGTPPAGEAAWRLSLVGDNTELLEKAVAGWREAIAKNPFGRG